MTDRFLPGVSVDDVTDLYNASGNEISSGKFDHPESSAALAGNSFGWFLHRPNELPVLPGVAGDWSPKWLSLEEVVRFPWTGGRHPQLDVLIVTDSSLIGVESKRFEPFRDAKTAHFSAAYRRDVWGENMRGYEQIRDHCDYQFLDAAQLVKHAFALRTAVHDADYSPHKSAYGLSPILFYLYAEPATVASNKINAHRQEINRFQTTVADDEVRFISCDYQTLLNDWRKNSDQKIRDHAKEIIKRFAP